MLSQPEQAMGSSITPLIPDWHISYLPDLAADKAWPRGDSFQRIFKAPYCGIRFDGLPDRHFTSVSFSMSSSVAKTRVVL
jgi:hypothetical protein